MRRIVGTILLIIALVLTACGDKNIGGEAFRTKAIPIKEEIKKSDVKKIVDDDTRPAPKPIVSIDSNETGNNTTPPINQSCEDSDNGLSYYVYGEVFTQGNNVPSIIDTCSGSYVNEGICTPDGGATTSQYLCPYGCLNGVCLEEVVIPPDNNTGNDTIPPTNDTWYNGTMNNTNSS